MRPSYDHTAILYVDRDSRDGERFRSAEGPHYRVFSATHIDEAWSYLEREQVCVVLASFEIEGTMDFFAQIRERGFDALRIAITDQLDSNELLVALQTGVVEDFIQKPWDDHELHSSVRYWVGKNFRYRELERGVAESRKSDPPHQPAVIGSKVVGENGGLRQVMEVVRMVAASHATVMVRGETGTGKEVIARALHALSDRRSRQLIKVDCGSLSPFVLESELFGHEKGAFTGATRTRRGRFELAESGTVFLDEVGNLPLDLQPKLLRLLQDREFERVGSEKTIRVDTRVITATNQPLEDLVDRGEFRQDLYYRLNVVPIYLPPLRERLGDLEPLISHFLRKHGGRRGNEMTVSPPVLEALRSYPWPGNVRELENNVERALLLAKGKVIHLSDFRLSLPTLEPQKTEDLRTTIREKERQKLEIVLVEAGGNVSKAARNLGVSRSTLRSKLKRFDIL